MKESEFSRSFSGMLSNHGFNVTRLESHGTSVGIPDMFIQGRGNDFWAELKSMPSKKFGDMLTVPWRPGQQAWAYDYYLAHGKKKCCLTVVKLIDKSVIIPMTCLFPDNRVTLYNYVEMLPRYLLRSVMQQDILSDVQSYRDIICKIGDNMYMDYDPEVIWDSIFRNRASVNIPFNETLDSPVRSIIWNIIAMDVYNYFCLD